MGDVDPLGDLERRLSGDVRVVTLEERSPGDLDRLRRGAGGQLQASVQVVGRDIARRHGRILR